MTITQSSINSTFAASNGDGYELQMGRHSRSLAPLFVAFAATGAERTARRLMSGRTRQGRRRRGNEVEISDPRRNAH
jgi:hypothetical protein